MDRVAMSFAMEAAFGRWQWSCAGFQFTPQKNTPIKFSVANQRRGKFMGSLICIEQDFFFLANFLDFLCP